MRKSAALFPIVFALGAIILTPGAGAREPTQLRKCQTISQPGSYELADNLTAAPFSDCLVITASFVTIDLAGFSIRGDNATGISAPQGGMAIAVRNGSISDFTFGVDLRSAEGSIVEGLHVSGGASHASVGIIASGIVKGNIVTGVDGDGITATGIVTGNIASGNFAHGIGVGPGSTVIGNTAVRNDNVGISVECPSNVIDNTAVNNNEINPTNLVLTGEGCNNTNNVAP